MNIKQLNKKLIQLIHNKAFDQAIKSEIVFGCRVEIYAYQDLKTWIKALSNTSQIIACENQDISYRWTNFNQATEVFNMRGNKQELAWVQQ